MTSSRPQRNRLRVRSEHLRQRVGGVHGVHVGAYREQTGLIGKNRLAAFGQQVVLMSANLRFRQRRPSLALRTAVIVLLASILECPPQWVANSMRPSRTSHCAYTPRCTGSTRTSLAAPIRIHPFVTAQHSIWRSRVTRTKNSIESIRVHVGLLMSHLRLPGAAAGPRCHVGAFHCGTPRGGSECTVLNSASPFKVPSALRLRQCRCCPYARPARRTRLRLDAIAPSWFVSSQAVRSSLGRLRCDSARPRRATHDSAETGRLNATHLV